MSFLDFFLDVLGYMQLKLGGWIHRAWAKFVFWSDVMGLYRII